MAISAATARRRSPRPGSMPWRREEPGSPISTSAAPFCSPSRAGLLTGATRRNAACPTSCFRPSTRGCHRPRSPWPNCSSERGYATACIGKWHLGWDGAFRPRLQGFDEFFGLPHPNDSTEWPVGAAISAGFRARAAPPGRRRPHRRGTRGSVAADAALHRAGRSIHPPEQGPALLPLPPTTMPHIPQYASAAFAGRSKGGYLR